MHSSTQNHTIHAPSFYLIQIRHLNKALFGTALAPAPCYSSRGVGAGERRDKNGFLLHYMEEPVRRKIKMASCFSASRHQCHILAKTKNIIVRD